MPALVDTTIRLLSQEPLADRVAAARLYELAEVLDEAGFAYLEVSGGGCFDAAVRRGVESPWERIRSIKARCSPRGRVLGRARIAPHTNTPCVLASERASHPDDERRSTKPS